MDEAPTRSERLWSVEEVAEYLGLSPKTLYGWRCRKSGPPSYRLGNKVRYRPAEVQEWVGGAPVTCVAVTCDTPAAADRGVGRCPYLPGEGGGLEG
jgi:excisionase family DNA binding protein